MGAIVETGECPTLEEIGAEVGRTSKSAEHHQLSACARWAGGAPRPAGARGVAARREPGRATRTGLSVALC